MNFKDSFYKNIRKKDVATYLIDISDHDIFNQNFRQLAQEILSMSCRMEIGDKLKITCHSTLVLEMVNDFLRRENFDSVITFNKENSYVVIHT